MELGKKVVLAVTLLSSIANAKFITGRCPEMDKNLNVEKAKARWAWVKKCDPVSYRYNVKFKKTNAGSGVSYPIFGIVENYETGDFKLTGYVAPTKADAECNIPEGHEIVAFCVAGCYTPNQELSFGLSKDQGRSFSFNRDEAFTIKPQYALSVAANSSLNNIEPKYRKVLKLTESLVAENNSILKFELSSGKTLEVTETHPMVSGRGMMKEAQSFKVGESFVTKDALKDEIVSISKKSFYGKVWNVAVKAPTRNERLVVANGYLSGDISFQNENSKFLNQLVMRTHLPKELIQ
ncbi:MAG: hypothetical protein ACPGJV_12025 [Bacteriovoracaceae bacterium]